MIEPLYLVHIAVDRDLKTTMNEVKQWKELIIDKLWNEYEFPGVYMSLITSDNIKKIKLYYGKYALFFSIKLLEQRNWHLNIKDHNGFVSEFNTFFPWNLDKGLEAMKKQKFDHNEVVFHDPIPMKYLCKIEDNEEVEGFFPTERLVNDEEPDLTKDPYYVFPFEDNYSGINMGVKKSTDNWFRMMAEVASIPITCMNKIVERSKYLYTHRTEQNIDILEEYTSGHKSINKKITQSSV